MSRYSRTVLTQLTIGLSSLAAVAVSQMPQANATSLSFTATGNNPTTNNSLGASVLFDDAFSPGNLAITLTNTGPGASAPSDVLTSVFWDYDGSPLTSLSLLSAIAPSVVGGTPGTNVNLASPLNEWKLPSNSNGTSDLPGITQNYGLGTAGLGIFQGGGGQQFNYGIINGYDNPNPAVSNGTFVNGAATFVLAGLPTGFDITKIGNIRFQYGTALSEPSLTGTRVTPPADNNNPPLVENSVSVPEPATMAGLSLVAASLMASRCRRLDKTA